MASVLAASAFAADRGTPDDAKVLVQKAAAHLKQVGAEKACADFKNTGGTYWDRDLFVFMYQADGKILCTPGIPGLEGRDANSLKDLDGKEFGKLIIQAAVGGGGWAEYRMLNPGTKKSEPKKTWAVREGDYVLGSGAYNP
jgi:signal transduction histidine kinase